MTSTWYRLQADSIGNVKLNIYPGKQHGLLADVIFENKGAPFFINRIRVQFESPHFHIQVSYAACKDCFLYSTRLRCCSIWVKRPQLTTAVVYRCTYNSSPQLRYQFHVSDRVLFPSQLLGLPLSTNKCVQTFANFYFFIKEALQHPSTYVRSTA